MLKECLKMSWIHIKTDKMRSFLTMLGIIIGVTSVIALITIVQGITGEMMSTFDNLGTNSLSVSANGSVLKSGLTAEDMEKLQEVEHVTGLSMQVQGSSSAVKDSTVIDSVIIKGTNEIYFEQKDDIMLLGRTLSPLDNSPDCYVCLIDETMVEEAFSGTNPVGETIIIGGHTYTIIGVTENDDSFASVFSGENDSTTVIIPYQNAMKLLGIEAVTNVDVYFSDAAYSEQVKTDLEAVLDEIFHYKDDTYSVTSLDSLIETMEDMSTMLTTMLAGIASISLLVGGVGIMNMMLVSVSERTKEIGLRKEIGAEPSQIQLQFCIEAVFLSLIGGLIGIVIGILISAAAGFIMGISIAPSVPAILLGVGFSASVGIGFGWAPSKKASRLNPIDALKSE